MSHTAKPLGSFLAFFALNVALLTTITPVYDFVCFLPYWERRTAVTSGLFCFLQRERRRREREAMEIDHDVSQDD